MLFLLNLEFKPDFAYNKEKASCVLLTHTFYIQLQIVAYFLFVIFIQTMLV